jgi:DNA-binding MarR family transcriptional regulator
MTEDPKMLVMNEVRALFHQMKRAAGRIHGRGEETAGQRGVLFSLAERGPQTVPQLAKMRPVSRQHMQMHVNTLLAEALVVRKANPNHRRSVLIELTASGKALVAALRKREMKLLKEIHLEATEKDLATALRVLRELKEWLATV